jgi:hypothetical protein
MLFNNIIITMIYFVMNYFVFNFRLVHTTKGGRLIKIVRGSDNIDACLHLRLLFGEVPNE